MGYDIWLKKDGEVVEVPKHMVGSTVVVGGSTEAWVTITYNYSNHFAWIDEVDGIRWLYGKKGHDCIDRLERAIEILGTRRSKDYWEPTPGNAGYVLSVLLEWARMHPEAVFGGD